MSDVIKTKKNLTQIKKGAGGIVTAISHSDKKVRNRLNAIGIYKGCQITRKNSGTPIIVDAGGVEVAIGNEFAEHIILETTQKVIFLLGNPNVGKSTIFSRLTGIKTDASNYPGTTVSLLNGEAVFNKNSYTIYDMPGIYSLEEDCKTAGESCMLLRNTPYDIGIYVVDSQHLERNLFFAMDMIALGKPIIILLNKYDVAQKKGINIDPYKLSQMLGVPVIPCNGLTGMGLKELSDEVDKIATGRVRHSFNILHRRQNRRRLNETALPHMTAQIPQQPEEKWKLIGKISAEAQKITHRHPSFLDHLERAATTSITGIPIALLIMAVSFIFILWTGQHIIDFLLPLYEDHYLPFMQNIFSFAKDTFMWTVLFGSANADAGGFGILSEGIKIAFIDVMPYVVIFYAVLEFLGDLGYLPRLAILLDSILHKVGLHGYSAIPIMLGFGCKVPAIMAVRSLETRRQKVIALALILMMVPCISQTAMMFSVIAPHGLKYLFLIFAVMIAVSLAVGMALNKILPGDTSDIFMEVPSWQMPKFMPFVRKLFRRAKEYIFEAVPLIMLGMLIITAAEMTGIINIVEKIMYYPVTVLLGLPAESASVVILGVFRKDISIALLVPFNMSAKQLVIACIFMAMYLPCTAAFFVLLKEGGWKDTLKIITITLGVAIVTGAALNMIL